jgi:hypothetical protein
VISVEPVAGLKSACSKPTDDSSILTLCLISERYVTDAFNAISGI